MIENVQSLVERLVFRIQKLKDLCQYQADRVADLERKNVDLLASIELLKEQNDKLTRVHENKVAAEAISVLDGGKEQARDKIDRLVREIDQCIAMLDQ